MAELMRQKQVEQALRSDGVTQREEAPWSVRRAGTYVDEKGIERNTFGVPTDPKIAHREWEAMGKPRA